MNLTRKLKLFLFGLISFIILFYDREPGINVLIFAFIAWFLMFFSQGGLAAFKKDRNFWVLTFFVLLTSGAFTFYGDPGSFFALVLCFYSLGVYMTDKTFQPLLYPLLLAYSLGSFIVRVFFISRWIPKRKRAADPNSEEQLSDPSLAKTAGQSTSENTDLQLPAATGAATSTTPPPLSALDAIRKETEHKLSAGELWIKTWLIPICIILLFVMVYMSSSSLFSDILVRIIPNLDFPMLYFVTIAGFYLLFNFMYLLPIPWFYTLNDKIISWDSHLQENISREQDASRLQFMARQQKAATLTLSLLIALLSVFILIYSYELYRGIHAARLSQAVHEQVNSIILSIIMAVAVILYYIKPGSLKEKTDNNKQPAISKSPLLHKLAYGWIVLNVILVISAGLHNIAYTSRYGLTYLRIGVYIFLILCIIGLYHTYIKIRRQRSAAYLIATMFKVFIATIALNSVMNWSAVITRYNLHYIAEPDINYLMYQEYNGHILIPSLMQDPHYKKDINLQNRLQKKFYWNKSEATKPWISRPFYYQFELFQLQKKGCLKSRQK